MIRPLLLLICCLLALPAAAQSTDQADLHGEVTAQPVCFNVVNKAPYTVLGTLSTNYYVATGNAATGNVPIGDTPARHRGNFRLEANTQTNFCSSGPFFPGQKLELVLHSLVPLYRCYTAIDGDIVITGQQDADGTTHDTKAACR